VPADETETAVARLLELVPEGHEVAQEPGGPAELAVYVPDDQVPALRRAFPALAVDPVADGWEDAWREFHHGVEIGPLWVGPPWEEPPPGAHAVVIDPGRAFGTGAHPTTRLALELLADQPRGSLLDAGCGSGVLAIAAARLGFRPVVAGDNDPEAVEVARENAARNGVELELCALEAVAGELPPADVVVANIALDVVEALAARVDCSRLVLSGYLADERPVARGFVHVARREASGWAADAYAPE
jgi:ribosomal protein L11 methyltransferase